MTLQEILKVKGNKVYKISPAETLSTVANKLVEYNCGSLIVCEEEGDRMLGIITERDILKACAGDKTPLEELGVREHMSTDLATGSLDDKVETIMGLMTKNRIRHLPVLEESRLVGVISIGDIVKAQHAHLSMENHYLKNYIQS